MLRPGICHSADRSQATVGLDFLGDSALSPPGPGTDLDLLLSEFWSRRLPPQYWTPGSGTFILVRRCLSQGTPSIRLSVSGGPLWACHSSRHQGPTEPSSAEHPHLHPPTLVRPRLLPGRPAGVLSTVTHPPSFSSLPGAACASDFKSLQPPLPRLSTLSFLALATLFSPDSSLSVRAVPH